MFNSIPPSSITKQTKVSSAKLDTDTKQAIISVTLSS